MQEYRFIRARLALRVQQGEQRLGLRSRTSRRARRRPDDQGAGIVETVIIVGLFAAAAILIVGVLVAKALDAANAVRTQ